MSFATRLKKVMDEREISQSELATLIGKGKSSVSQYLSGKNIPKDEVQKKIAEVLDCTVDYLNAEVPMDDHSPGGLYNVPVHLCSKVLNKSEQFVRVALQMGTAPFGFASKKSTKWSYHISPKKLKDYVGEEQFNKFIQT